MHDDQTQSQAQGAHGFGQPPQAQAYGNPKFAGSGQANRPLPTVAGHLRTPPTPAQQRAIARQQYLAQPKPVRAAKSMAARLLGLVVMLVGGAILYGCYLMAQDGAGGIHVFAFGLVLFGGLTVARGAILLVAGR